MIEIILILETADDREHNHFNNTDCLEDFLKTINLKDYEYTGILFMVDGECNHAMTKIYKKRYLQ